ncbi:ubiquitin carboxyl-terminal hydrolase 20-like [Tubulanus polymorphus]|uniref:ubiquitin carboxyl-terminal hydrolase 20-like n=1 Tax=Tubulanus polymorphus TaxID=672921 RepID=UPI003DA3894E
MQSAGHSNCPHVVTCGNFTLKDVRNKRESAQCEACQADGPNLWLCLYNKCLYIGCGESAEDHSSSHAEISKHCVTLNLTTMRVWCYTCEIEVFPGRNLPVFNIPEDESGVGFSEGSPIKSRRTLSLSDSNSVCDSETDDDDENKRPRGLTGLQNLGNTCYMNAALQALSNCPPLTRYFLDCAGFVRTDKKPMLCRSYLKLVSEMWHRRRPSYMVPSSVLNAIKLVHPMFKGYSQQDTQEFLRCFMDQIHEELKQVEPDWFVEEPPEIVEETVIEPMTGITAHQQHQIPTESQGAQSDVEEYETCDSGLSSERGSIERTGDSSDEGVVDAAGVDSHAGIGRWSTRKAAKDKRAMKGGRKNDDRNVAEPTEKERLVNPSARDDAIEEKQETENVKEETDDRTDAEMQRKTESVTQIEDSPDSDLTVHSTSYRQTMATATSDSGISMQGQDDAHTPTSETGGEYTDALCELEQQSSSSLQQRQSQKLTERARRLSENRNSTAAKNTSSQAAKKKKTVQYRSVISDIFDGKILSSVQCLTCERISSTKETFQDLSLPLPSKDHIHLLHATQTSGKGSCGEVNLRQGWVTWMWSWMKSWFWGPTITLQDCLAAFFSADELKGDNMYSCERCKKLRNGVKFSKVTELPEILCIHLKRLRHEFMFSSKISSYVSFPMEGLDMGPYLHKDCVSDVTVYDLIAVICHHGTAGGGHYTSYSLNMISDQWYEFDDQYVTQVDEPTVDSCEAYVLFYRKRNDAMIPLRQKASELMEMREESLMQFYVSKQWINKFNTFAEPGPISNHDFLCRHGGVPPSKVQYVDELVTPLTQNVWEFLHERFGGGPPVNHLYPCKTCEEESEKLLKRQKFEMETFIKLNDEFRNEADPEVIYTISMSWFKDWENFVRGKDDDAPGPIDNSKIAMTKNGVQMLKSTSDYGQLSVEMWQFLYGIYGGGPELVFKDNGSVSTTTTTTTTSADVKDGAGDAAQRSVEPVKT